MKFKGHLVTPVLGEFELPILYFTKTRIIFPKQFKGRQLFEKTAINHNARYKLEYDNMDDLDRRLRYFISVENEKKIHLYVDKINERKLKLIHGLYPFQKNATAAIIIAILSLTISTILGLLKLTGC